MNSTGDSVGTRLSGEGLIRASDPATSTLFGKGDQADAEPAVPGWRLAVDDLFP